MPLILQRLLSLLELPFMTLLAEANYHSKALIDPISTCAPTSICVSK
jgi:hypothetical protein